MGASRDVWGRGLGKEELRSCSQAGDNSKHYDLGIQANVPFFILTDGAHLGVFIWAYFKPRASEVQLRKLITVKEKAMGPKGCHSC